MTIPLIDKQDNFEIILAQISAILAAETLAQQALATEAGKDPALWAFDVYLESSDPLSRFQDEKTPRPLVNVWFDDSNFPKGKGNVVSRQESETSYKIDIYTSIAGSDNPAGGHNKGDEVSSKDVHRMIRLVRNILMHPDNTYLGLRGLVWRRWAGSIQTFQPQIDDRPVQNVAAARISFGVGFNEVPVVETYYDLTTIYIQALRAEDGKIIFDAGLYPDGEPTSIFKITPMNDAAAWTSGDDEATAGNKILT